MDTCLAGTHALCTLAPLALRLCSHGRRALGSGGARAQTTANHADLQTRELSHTKASRKRGREHARDERLTGEKVRRKRTVRGERLTDMDRDMLEWKGRDGEAYGNRNTH